MSGDSPADDAGGPDAEASTTAGWRRLGAVAALGALSAFLGGLAVTILDPGSIPLAVGLLVLVAGILTASAVWLRD